MLASRLALACALTLSSIGGVGCSASSDPPKDPIDVEEAQTQPTDTATTPPSSSVRRKRPPPVQKTVEGDYAACIAQLRESSNAAPHESSGVTTYDRALREERDAQLDMARRDYLKTIMDAPQSELVPFSYFAFGILFSHDAQADASKWQFAEQSFNETMKYSQSRARLVVHVELGRTYIGMGEPAKAKRELQTVAMWPGHDTDICADEARAEGARLAATLPTDVNSGNTPVQPSP